MKRLIATSFILATLTATTGCTRDRGTVATDMNVSDTVSGAPSASEYGNGL